MYRLSVSQTPEESLGRLLIIVFGFGLAFGLLMNLVFALWITLKIARTERSLERWMKDQDRR